MSEDYIYGEDILLYTCAKNACADEVDAFLKGGMKIPRSSRFKKIMQKIKHPANYKNGRMSPESVIIAIALLTVLALCFVLIGVFASKFVFDITGGTYHSFLKEKEEASTLYGITEFKRPKIPDARRAVTLVKSSLLYSVEFTRDTGCIYYLQKPKKESTESHGKNTVDTQKTDALIVTAGGKRAEIIIYQADNRKLFEIRLDDEKYSYSISGCNSMEEAVKFAESISLYSKQ